MLRTRIITALLLLPPVIAVIYWGGILFTALTLVVFFIINYEFFSFATGYGWQRVMQHVIALCPIPFGFLWNSWSGFAAGLFISLVIQLILQVVIVESDAHELEYSEKMPASILGLAYTGVLGSMFVVTSILISGKVLLWLLGMVIAADTFAYFGGRVFGGPKMSPRISPKKTVSGGICGLVGAVLIGILLGVIFKAPTTLLQLGFSGLLVGVFSIFGDLVESLIKRAYNVKDSGDILPGHGGLLDRVDALMFTLPLLFFISW